jgi:DNA-directed RNA polymerase subunit RPC12/RpoP
LNIFSIFNKNNKICESLGHDLNGCKCRRCGKKIHEWEQIETEVRQIYLYAGYPRKQETIIYNCRKCGKKTKKHEISESE